MTEQHKQLVSYIRVSTQRQGDSGLGLEAQQGAVYRYAALVSAPIIREFREVETAKKNETRPVLAKALQFAKERGAQLVVAKLDRLARDVLFTATLQKARVDFVCCDNPDANTLTIQLLAAVAEDELRRISTRTSEALARAKARGVPLGANDPRCHKFTRADSIKGGLTAGRAASQAAKEAYLEIVPVVLLLRQGGATLEEIAASLNQSGRTTRTGKRWSKGIVCRLLQMVNGNWFTTRSNQSA